MSGGALTDRLASGGLDAVVGVDVGGTNTVVGLFAPDLTRLAKASMPTLCAPSPGSSPSTATSAFFDRLAVLIDGMIGASGATRVRIGAGVPGRVRSEDGLALRAVNLGWANVPFAKELSTRLGRDVVIDNDVRLYTLGETIAGAGAGCRTVVCAVLGTGMAVGAVVEGALVRGSRSYAGEVGHDPVPGNDAVCNCGNVGCLETIASATGIARLARAAGLANGDAAPLTAKQVGDAAAAGDPTAAAVFEAVGRTLAAKLVTVARLLDPDVVVIGGGAAEAGEPLLGPMRETFAAAYADPSLAPPIRKGALGDDAGITGAASFALLPTAGGRRG